ncbi:MAG TPA: protein phosphatase, partial [Cyanothece sp. UBA12306]|nr:protein phosphatase [Cyanothece sp. UBA12306]
MNKSTLYPSYVWWVIPEKLAGMPRPSLEDLPQLYQAGLRGIVSVIDEPSLIMEYQKEQFSALSLPIVEDLPPTLPQVEEFIKFAETIMSDNQAVAVHCTGGNHRTGTLLAS